MFNGQQNIAGTILAAALLCLPGCTTSDPPLQYREIGEEFKAYALFRPGSMWVYEHKATARLDTIIVMNVDTFVWIYGTDLDPEYRFRYQAYKTQFNSNRIGFTESEYSPCSRSDMQSEMTEIWRMFFGSRYNIIFDPKVETGLMVDQGHTQGYYTNINKNISVEIGNKTYHNVWLTTVTDYYYPDSTLNYEFAIARNYGIIRVKRIAGNLEDEWILFNSNLFQ